MPRFFNQVVLICLLFLTGCQSGGEALPTLAAVAAVPVNAQGLPATFTPLPATAVPTLTPTPLPAGTRPPTETPLPLPTITPYTPRPSRTPTPTITPTGGPPTATPVIKAIHLYGINEVIPYQAFPVPAGNNGWGMHWIPTTSQDPGVVDRFVGELVRMHIKWLVFLNEGDNTTDNNYLVDKLVASGIMPIMRIYRSDTSPYDGDIGGMVAHYRARGVYYFQIYNEPNVNVENGQGFANPNQYAVRWAAAARQVVANGGLPGIGAFSPGGEYNHYDFLDRTLRALEFNGDAYLLNHAWLSVHNYHGVRQRTDPGGFLLFRRYNDIVQSHLGRSLPMLGTEGGSYSSDRNVEKSLLIWQYTYMRDAEPYFLVFSNWLLANSEGGAWDGTWEWQALFQPGFVHPVVTDFFYTTAR
ncbi:MAG: hypothetical protein H6658_00170 [Ardenticatenaceae bacterium]|nr:hypothetical protein [Ardenticatenaceae bacterium]